MQVWLRAGEVPLLVVGPVPHQGGVPLPQVPGQVQAIDAQGGGGQMDLCCAVSARHFNSLIATKTTSFAFKSIEIYT